MKGFKVLSLFSLCLLTALVSAQQEFEIVEMSARELHKSRQALVILDARPTVMYEQEHIAGALSLPTVLFEQHYRERASRLPKDKLVVTYCGSSKCAKSHYLAKKLAERGHRVAVLRDGLTGWKAEGFPVEAVSTAEKTSSATFDRSSKVFWI